VRRSCRIRNSRLQLNLADGYFGAEILLLYRLLRRGFLVPERGSLGGFWFHVFEKGVYKIFYYYLACKGTLFFEGKQIFEGLLRFFF
jgi:hypothetical protein